MSTPHTIQRLRHETRRRTLAVTAIADIAPRMRRITFGASDLADFVSLGVDDHVKLFFPDAATGETVMRDFTPRAYDNAAQSLTIDFALHDHGPASDWARAAHVGAALEIGGPRGSIVVADDFDWVLMIADETGLPAIGRRLEALRAGVKAITVVLVDGAGDELAIETAADWQAHWVHRSAMPGDDGARLLAAARALAWPSGDGYVWIAAEAGDAKALRDHVLGERGHPAGWLRASGYWVRGEGGAHENL